ncbi:FKBP-type peptidyl-prolyl cis-trans isomerase [Desulfotalea psychrophila]|uniref:Peptidyl-prolyl cis-trans isomerase n=1 Tax=Desulfotalea psychrophila (strain LSv54 / DSM 12343) TaxID=177439 RepID=Q6AJV6_DESPS|nr:FKBP-type peptidyl-prolyl cis-trans isomerase [Desulfotalea psychrophila]CAG37370.1 related to peptidyl-prolyl cis-trans isomerase (FKBP-type) [Desulfotalea psychrophila LSv54]
MPPLQDNTVVILSYIGKLDNGEIFQKIDVEAPIKATLGSSELPPMVEEAVRNMTPGESTSVRVPPEEGFGPRQKILLQEIENKEFIERVKPKPGMIITLNAQKDGAEEPVPVPATIMEINGDTVLVDYNHPLAGHHLTYDVTLIAVE